MSFLTPEAFRPVLEHPVPEFNLRYTPGTLEALMQITRCQPFLTQAVAKELVDLMNVEKRWEATLADLEQAVQKALLSGEEYLFNVWDDAEPEGQELLTALARGQRPASSPVHDRLCEMDVLDAEGCFAVPLFERWVKEQVGIEHSQL